MGSGAVGWGDGLETQGPHSQIFMMGGGGPTEVHILYPKISQLRNLSTQKISLLFLTYPKKSLTVVLFLQPKKFPPFYFRDPKKSPLAKISNPKSHLDPPLSLKYASVAPGG